jgi:hypothetical protein
VSDYTPHSSGQTTFTFDPKMYNCGRVQVDVSIFDAAGNEILIVGVVINYGSTCAPPTSALVCQPPAQNAIVGEPVSFTASGGTGAYSWSASSGSPASGTGSGFTTSYAGSGTYVATVTSGSATATCQVTVTTATSPELVCAPPTQTAQAGQTVTVNAAGGTGSYNWSAPGGSTSTGTGASFSTSFASSGTNTITVTSGQQTATCQVTVPPVVPQLACTPPTQTVEIGQTASVGATGGTGTYSWSAPGGSTTSGSGVSFNTSYAAAGSYNITVTSGQQTATCVANVPPPLVNSCTGVTAVITRPIQAPTGIINVTVPAGQQADIRMENIDHQANITTWQQATLGAGVSELRVPLACFPKLAVYCGERTLDAGMGVNQCELQ